MGLICHCCTILLHQDQLRQLYHSWEVIPWVGVCVHSTSHSDHVAMSSSVGCMLFILVVDVSLVVFNYCLKLLSRAVHTQLVTMISTGIK